MDGPFVGMLMANPHLKAMRKGHIHSHNHMGVFFSGTDTTEIMDNSAFHNYYVSLIVNNINEMVAKVAYRVHRSTVSSTHLTYNDINGSPVTTTEHSEVKDDTVMIYDCDIIKPQIPGAFTRDRFRFIRDKKSAENTAKNKSFVSTRERSQPNIGIKSCQTEVFDVDNKEMLKKFNDMVEKNNKVFYKPFSEGGDILTPGQLFEISDTPSNYPVGSAIDDDIRNWMVDLIGNGVKNQMLSQVLGNLSKRIKSNGLNIEKHLTVAMDSFEESYFHSFEDDPYLKELNTRTRIAITMLINNYSEKYPNLISKIIFKLRTTL